MKRLTLFFDDGGVMNDNLQRGVQWPPLVSEFFMPLLGGTSEAWIEANRILINQLLEPHAWQARIQAAPDYVSFDQVYALDWLRGMCELMGVSAPSSEEECIELAQQANGSIIRRVHADFPGVVDTIRSLHRQGYMLYTASGEPSVDLAGHLEGMGVLDCFSRLYGPDLINTFKIGPEYYERLFADVGVFPGDALVVDDSPQALKWAFQVGARTVLVSSVASEKLGTTICIRCLADLPEVIGRLG